jgi:transposase
MSVAATPEEVIRVQGEQINALQAALTTLEHENKRLHDQLMLALRRAFHKTSERLDPDQIRLFAEMLMGAESVREVPAELTEKAVRPKQRRKGHGRAPFPAHLPREVIEIELPAEERICADCGQPMREIGTETSERGHIVPARIMVRRFVRKKYACPCGHGIRTAALPPSLIEKCKYETSVYAHLTVAKYGDHLPLHRLAAIYKRHGFSLPKSTMWEMLQRVDELVGQPILRQARTELLQEPNLQADETPVTVQLEDRRGSRKGYIWCYGVGKKRVFDFTMSRERAGPTRFLKGWTGTLQTDGYSGYNEVTRTNHLRRAGCWSHARRYVKDALDTGTLQALHLLRPIQRLFWIERAIQKHIAQRGASREELLALRRDCRARLSTRVLERIETRAEALRRKRSTLPKSTLGKALTYLKNQAEPLKLFLQDPALEIHNNDSERALRHVVTGRKNWLFFGSPRGAQVGANLFSLVATCKALGVNAETYLEDILSRIDSVPASQIARLTPWTWAQEHPAST